MGRWRLAVLYGSVPGGGMPAPRGEPGHSGTCNDTWIVIGYEGNELEQRQIWVKCLRCPAAESQSGCMNPI